MTTKRGTLQPAPQQTHHIIRSLSVTGGFLKDLKLELVDGLNCFIGGRGAGKTTALEFLRFGLGLMPDQRVAGARFRHIDGLVKDNLRSGRISVEIETKNEMRYTATRGLGEAVQVKNAAGAAVAISLDKDLIFSADVYSQNEIEEIAASPSSQLAILDRFAEDESLAIVRELELLMERLQTTSTALRRLDEEIDGLRAKATEVQALEERLKGLVDVGGPDAARTNAAHAAKAARAKEGKTPALLQAAVQRFVRETSASAATLASSIDAHLDRAVREGVNQAIFASLSCDMQSLTTASSTAVVALSAAAATAEKAITVQAGLLAERHANQEAEYAALIADSAEAGGRIAERGALQEALATATAAAREQAAREGNRLAIVAERSDILNRVSDLKDRRFENRRKVAEEITRRFTTIRVTIEQAAELEKFRECLAEAMKSRGLQHNAIADRLSQVFLPRELVAVIEKEDHKVLVDKGGYDEDRARRILSALRLSGIVYSLEGVEIDDRPSIELKDGETYKEAPALSTGQRCTTILPILLMQSERPLLIDQPEDNLDNQFVFQTIVKALREVKGTRQVIFVTHNPNIPVLGDAERVFVFSSDGQHATLRQVGDVNACRKSIEQILEGGPDAFQERKKRYGY